MTSPLIAKVTYDTFEEWLRQYDYRWDIDGSPVQEYFSAPMTTDELMRVVEKWEYLTDEKPFLYLYSNYEDVGTCIEQTDDFGQIPEITDISKLQAYQATGRGEFVYFARDSIEAGNGTYLTLLVLQEDD